MENSSYQQPTELNSLNEVFKQFFYVSNAIDNFKRSIVIF